MSTSGQGSYQFPVNVFVTPVHFQAILSAMLLLHDKVRRHRAHRRLRRGHSLHRKQEEPDVKVGRAGEGEEPDPGEVDVIETEDEKVHVRAAP